MIQRNSQFFFICWLHFYFLWCEFIYSFKSAHTQCKHDMKQWVNVNLEINHQTCISSLLWNIKWSKNVNIASWRMKLVSSLQTNCICRQRFLVIGINILLYPLQQIIVRIITEAFWKLRMEAFCKFIMEVPLGLNYNASCAVVKLCNWL